MKKIALAALATAAALAMVPAANAACMNKAGEGTGGDKDSAVFQDRKSTRLNSSHT